MGGCMCKKRRTFDPRLQDISNDVVSTLASAGFDIGELSFESMKAVMGSLHDMNQKLVKVILESRDVIWKNHEFIELVEEYFDTCFRTLDLCNALEKCLKQARESQQLIHDALQNFNNYGVEGSKYTTTLEELKSYKAAGNPFTEEFFLVFQSVYVHQILMLEKLQSRKNNLDKKFKHIHAWRKVLKMIFASALAAVLICSVVAAAIPAPPVAGAVAAASAIPIGSIGLWIDSPLKNCEDAMHEIINSIEVRTSVSIKDLGTIRMLIDKLETEIESLLSNVDSTTNEEAVEICIEAVRRKVDFFMKDIDDLEVQADICSSDIQSARILILQRIMSN